LKIRIGDVIRFELTGKEMDEIEVLESPLQQLMF
jgi:4-hydroxy-3-methylbut-2-en-1-yl diphosphate synthase IspG/GcpE